MKNKERIERLKQQLGCKTNTDLASFLSVSERQVYLWASMGMASSIERMVDAILPKEVEITMWGSDEQE